VAGPLEAGREPGRALVEGPAGARAGSATSDAGEHVIGRVLRSAAVSSGALFLLSVVLTSLPGAGAWERELFLLRAAAASLLVVAPVVRLIVAGTFLALHREWRYAAAALGILVMLAISVGLGYAH